MGWVDRFIQNPVDAVTDNKFTSSPQGILMGAGLLAGGLGAAGMFGAGGAGAATAAGAGDTLASTGAGMGLGSLPIDSAGLQSMGWMDGALGSAGTAAGEAGVGAGAGGLGSMIGVEGGAPVSVTIPGSAGGSMGGLSSGSGLGSLFDSGSLGSMPVNSALLQQIPNFASSGSSSNPSVNWGSLGQTASNFLAGNRDRITNQQDQQYWQNYMDQMTHMYQPGSPEANMLQQKMEAQDAAAGRNSQYGVRQMNLAGILAQQRANIMTNPTFYRMGAAATGHYDNSLNSLFGAMNYSNTNPNPNNGGGSGLSNLYNAGQSLYNNWGNISDTVGNVGNSISNGLSSFFGG